MRMQPADSRLAIVLHAERVRVLVVGGGQVAERRALAFAERGAAVRVVTRHATDALRDAAAHGTLDLTLKSYDIGDLADAERVGAATDDRATNARVATESRAAHRLCNVADAPEEGSFSTVAQRLNGALLLAVGARGVPAAAVRLLDLIADRYDERYGDALAALGALRESLLARGDRLAWERASNELLRGDLDARVEDGSLIREVRAWR